MAHKNTRYKKITTFKFFVLLLSSFTLLSTSIGIIADHSTPHSLEKSPVVEKIIIKGLKRTKEHVVRRELLFTENDALTPQLLLASVQRLKNLRLFSKVLPFLKLKDQNQVELTIELQEKWTTIPFFNFSGGGDTFYAYAGVYDINTFGTFFETGARYDNWNGKNGGVVWFRNPRTFEQRILTGADLWSTTRPRILYTRDGEKQGEYILNQKKFNFLLSREFKEWLNLGLTFGFSQDEIIDTVLTNEIDPTTLALVNNTNRSNELSVTFSLKLGKLNYDNYLVSGKQSIFNVKYAGSETGSEKDLLNVEWKNTVFWRLPHKSNIGFRFLAGATDTSNIQNYHYIGGFENVRGYFDGQFRSKAYWQLNTEYRIPSYQSDWVVLQHIFFIDAANAANQLDDLTRLEDTIYSAGTGVRLISPKVYSFNARLDIALLTSQKASSFISFGAQQFF